MATRVKFTRDEEFECEGRHQGHTFKEGEVYDFDEAFAQRWIRRGSVDVLAGGAPSASERFTPVEVVVEVEVAPAVEEAASAKTPGKAAKATVEA